MFGTHSDVCSFVPTYLNKSSISNMVYLKTGIYFTVLLLMRDQ